MDKFNQPPENKEAKGDGTVVFLYKKLGVLANKLPQEEKLKLMLPIQSVVLAHMTEYGPEDLNGIDNAERGRESYEKVIDLLRKNIEILEGKAAKA